MLKDLETNQNKVNATKPPELLLAFQLKNKKSTH